MTWPSYLINLDANAARLANSTAQFAAHGIAFERIAAVDGRALADPAPQYDAAANAARAKAPLVPSEIGCYLSHIAAWRRIAAGDAAGGFVFEDDFLGDDTLGAVMARLSDGPRDWDIVKLFSFDQTPKVLSETPLGPDHRLVVPYRVPTCLIGYGIAREAAVRLLAQVPPFFRPVDEDHKFFWETGLTVALVLPSPVTVGDQQAVTGTIGAERRARKPKGLGTALRSLRYRLGYAARLHWHRWRGVR